ncbi:MAG: flavodoxin [Elusimicrobiota bacterium]|jgi:flavodoxin|nr:flavodoxin [Elusimicrobiota bacterium]
MGKVLVAYYSLDGATADMARQIQARCGGDIFELKPLKPYGKLTAYARGIPEIKTGVKPPLKNDADIAPYDIIFIGGPVWAFDVTPPVATFLSKHDFSGKTIAPFCTHQGMPLKYFEHFAKACKDAKITQGLALSLKTLKDKEAAAKAIEQWVKTI